MLENIEIGVAIALIVVIIVGISNWAWSACSSFFKPDRFSLRFVDHAPPREREIDTWGSYHIPLGESEHWVKVVCNPGLKLQKFGLRFIPLEDLNKDLGDPPADIRRIIFIREIYLTKDVVLHGHNYVQVNDGLGGIEGTFTPPLLIGRGKGFFIKLRVRADQPWSGKISFEGLDEGHDPQYGRWPVHAGDPSKEPAQYKLADLPPQMITETHNQVYEFVTPKRSNIHDQTMAPGCISMKDAAISLYTEARGKKHTLAEIAEEMSGWSEGHLVAGSSEDILDYMATYIAFCKKLPLFGRRVPSTTTEQISWEDVRASTFVGGATKLEHIHKSSTYFMDLSVKSDDVKDLIEQLQFEDGFHSET